MAISMVSKFDSGRQDEQISLTIPVLEVHLLNDLAHAQSKGRGADDVGEHPGVTSVEGRHGLVALSGGTSHGSLDISPSSDNGAEDHQTKREQDDRGNSATEPKDFTVRNNDNGQVLEDGEDGNREELKGLASGVNHARKKERDGEPCGDLRLVGSTGQRRL